MTTQKADPILHQEWHCAINKHHDGKIGTKEWKHWMYEAKRLAYELPRLVLLFRMERTGQLPRVHRHCSHSQPEPVPDNHLRCCLGVECRKCDALVALEVPTLTPEQIDQAKAYTCATHIISTGGDTAGEGYLLTVDDRMFWDTTYAHMGIDDEPSEE